MFSPLEMKYHTTNDAAYNGHFRYLCIHPAKQGWEASVSHFVGWPGRQRHFEASRSAASSSRTKSLGRIQPKHDKMWRRHTSKSDVKTRTAALTLANCLTGLLCTFSTHHGSITSKSGLALPPPTSFKASHDARRRSHTPTNTGMVAESPHVFSARGLWQITLTGLGGQESYGARSVQHVEHMADIGLVYSIQGRELGASGSNSKAARPHPGRTRSS